uniref:Late embryogenesis abundant protein LEA-2 subgroup domain-containing protein n=1 Tax=Oryza meridionalis TaxID=40149 RepID=A0A0E0E690_9ORYZ
MADHHHQPPPPPRRQRRPHELSMAAEERHHGTQTAMAPDDDGRHDRGGWIRPEEKHRSSGVAWALVILCTLVAVGVIVAGATVFAVYLIYKPRMPYLVVSDAQLVRLDYDQGGTIDYLEALVTVMARNTNSRADASFARVDLALRFHGADVARLRAAPFVVASASAAPLRYDVVSKGRALDAGGMRAMDASLKSGVVPLDLLGRARTRWKVGIFASLKFWTRISCRLHFFYPGNGTVMDSDRNTCTSRSP